MVKKELVKTVLLNWLLNWFMKLVLKLVLKLVWVVETGKIGINKGSQVNDDDGRREPS